LRFFAPRVTSNLFIFLSFRTLPQKLPGVGG
jgi:hypothetical protein